MWSIKWWCFTSEERAAYLTYRRIKFGEGMELGLSNLLVINILNIISCKYLSTCSFLILSEQMLLWKQLNYIPILLLQLHSNIHYVIRGLSRDRFDESPARVLTRLKAPGFLSLCNALLSVVLFLVWTSGRVICPICYQEFIPHRKSMETIAGLGLTPPPELYCIKDAFCSQQQLSLLTANLSPSHICSATWRVWIAFKCWCFSRHGVKASHIQTRTRPSLHRNRASTGRVQVEVDAFSLCSTV